MARSSVKYDSRRENLTPHDPWVGDCLKHRSWEFPLYWTLLISRELICSVSSTKEKWIKKVNERYSFEMFLCWLVESSTIHILCKSASQTWLILGINWRNQLWIPIKLVEWNLKLCISESWMLSTLLGCGPPFEQYSLSLIFLPSRWDQLAWTGWGTTSWCPGPDYLAPQAESPGETGNRLEHMCFNFANMREIMSVWSTLRFVFLFCFLHGKHLLIDPEYDYNTVNNI